MSRYLSGQSSIASALTYQYINATNQITTSSSTFVTTGISLTVIQTGTYQITFNANTRVGSSGTAVREGQASIFINSTNLTASTSSSGIQIGGLLPPIPQFHMCVCATIVTNLTAGDVVDLRYRLAQGSAAYEMTNRQLIITKVG